MRCVMGGLWMLVCVSLVLKTIRMQRAIVAESEQIKEGQESDIEIDQVINIAKPSVTKPQSFTDGLFPYTLCGVKEQYQNSSSALLTTQYKYHGELWKLVIGAVSVWEHGYIELLVYYSYATRHCELSPGTHCVIPPNAKFDFSCKLNNISVTGEHETPMVGHPTEFSNVASVLRCGLWPFTELVEHVILSILIMGDEKVQLDIPLCHAMIKKSETLTICTQPHFGWSENTFWLGQPRYEQSDLLQMWLTFHTEVLNYSVRFNDLQSEFREKITNYNSPRVSYRSGWDLSEIFPVSGRAYDYECFAESVCMWDMRLSSNWTIILHAVDNFIMPHKGKLDEILNNLQSDYSSVIIPMVHGYTNEKYNKELNNVLQRWVLRGKPIPFGDARHTPAANPRHVQFSFVHWNIGLKKELFKKELSYLEAWNAFGLSTLHLMTLARPEMNNPELGEYDGNIQMWGNLLAETMRNKEKSIQPTFRPLSQLLQGCGEICSIEGIQEHPSLYFPYIEKKVDCEGLMRNAAIDASMEAESPPEEIPAALLEHFSYRGKVPIGRYQEKVFNQRYMGSQALVNVWTQEMIEEMKSECERGTLNGNYGVHETNALVRGIRKMDVVGKHILVLGSENPWVEACLLACGAARTTTIEYGAIDSLHPQVAVHTPARIRDNSTEYMMRFDAVVSYSSLEHSGLGRYGDSMNPWGDRQAAARAWCMTKRGGMFLLGVPGGGDSIAYNAHRTYGIIQLPHLLANWKQVWRDNEYGGHNELFLVKKSSFYVTAHPEGRLANQLFIVASSYEIARREKKEWCLEKSERGAWNVLNDAVIEWDPFECPSHVQFIRKAEQSNQIYDNMLFDLGDNHVQYARYLQVWRYVYDDEGVPVSLPFRLRYLEEQMKWVKEQRVMVGLHIRRTDFVGLNFMGGSAPLGYYEKVVKYLMIKYDLKPQQFVVCSDDMAWVEAQAIFAGMHKYHESPAQDMAMIAACQHVVFGVGSYGWWCAYWRDVRTMGETWAYDGEMDFDRSDYFPPHWRILGQSLQPRYVRSTWTDSFPVGKFLIPEAMREAMLYHNSRKDFVVSQEIARNIDTPKLKEIWEETFYKVWPVHTRKIQKAVISAQGDVKQCDGNGEVLFSLGCAQEPLYMQCDGARDVEEELVIVITQYWGENYYHAIIEDLSRLAFVMESDDGSELQRRQDIVSVHVADKNSLLLRELVALLGFGKMVSGTVFAKEVWLPPSTPCGGHIWSAYNDMFRRVLWTKLPERNISTKTMVIINRGALADSRKISNHETLMDETRKIWKEEQYAVVEHRGTESLIDQLILFQNAEAVMGPHGAAMANIITMRVGKYLIEFAARHGANPMNFCYQTLAYTLGLSYFGFLEETSNSEGNWALNITNVMKIVQHIRDIKKKM